MVHVHNSRLEKELSEMAGVSVESGAVRLDNINLSQ